MKELCKRIKAAKKNGITRKIIAEKIGISYDYLNRYLGEFKKPMPDHIRQGIEEILKDIEHG
jgi:transcriptional regulator with XRE-family HTH domain